MVAAVNSVIDIKLKPIFVDNAIKRLNPSFEMILEKVTKRTKAIIVTHTYGVPV